MPFARPEDIVACYRLFLNREPDKAGLRHFTHLISGGKFPTHKLADLFAQSPEAMAGAAARSAATVAAQIIGLDGFRMMVFPEWNAVNGEIATTRTYEPHITKHFVHHVKPGTIVADIGANCGYFTMLATSKGATVHAFEPHGRNVWLVEKNAALNGFDRITIHPQALADIEKLVVYSPLLGNGQISVLGDAPPADGQEIPRTTTLDRAMGAQPPHVIKIDVEGAEETVMAGAASILETRPIVFSEFSAAGIESTSHADPARYLARFSDHQLYLCQRDGELIASTAAELIEASRRSEVGFIDFVALPHGMAP